MDSENTLSNQLTTNFSKYMKKYQLLYMNLTQKCKQYLPSTQTSLLILDIGSGPGILTNILKKEIPNASIIGIEPSDAMIHTVQKEKFTYFLIKGQVENIPIMTEMMDCIITRYSLPYWKDSQIGIQEIFRILKPGGHVLFEALNRNYPKWKLKMIDFQMKLKKAPTDIIKYHIDAYKQSYTIEELEKKLENENFKVIEREYKKNDWRYLLVAEKAHR